MLLSEIVQLREFKGNPNAGTFKTTDHFKQVYGNYCGPGNRGGEPIDDIDAACQSHDMCYHYNDRNSPECDRRFVKRLNRVLNKDLTLKQRYYAMMMRAYFNRRLRKGGK